MNSFFFRCTNIFNVLILCIIILSCSRTRSSTKLQNNDIKNIESAFVNAFNEGRIEEFRVMFDTELKHRNSIEELKDNFDKISSQTGKIYALTLDEVQDLTFIYKSKHQKMVTLKVVLGINDIGEVSKMEISNDYKYRNPPILDRNVSDLILPFRGKWYVFWGGKKGSNNYHNAYPSMQGAFDFWVMGSNGKSHRIGATKNEDFYAFGKELMAPIDAKVVYIFDEVPDNDWPNMNSTAGVGNVVLLETKNKEYILLGHLKQHSIVVKRGQYVKQGQLLGLCGNSGNSTEPHLHFQVQNLPDFAAAKGAWVHFKKIKVNGEIKEDYIPKRGDKISN
ncbi:M23 family metallopeptidase [Aquimarina sp. AU474]|uniref:M23 family metallopeptidase n=1 Tax=Aquimarina sp. AU474 TaxID=2108529 RepID=UPI000D693D9C|nr:M23 family metallopeptidase [Aquimarina sp. AU474]